VTRTGHDPMSAARRRGLLRLGALGGLVGGAAVAGISLADGGARGAALPRATRSPHPGRSAASPEPDPLVDLAVAATAVSGHRGRVVESNGTGAVSLTFDDGPQERSTPAVLAFLAEHHLHATFSLIGRQVERYPGLARSVAAAGMSLCNHTWDHDEALASRPRAAIERDVERAQSVIGARTGVAPGFFRAPGGSWSHTVLDVCADAGLIPLGWDVDSRDWSRPGVAGIVANVTSEVRPGSVLLFHDGGGNREQTLQALPRVLSLLAARGYGVTRLTPGRRPTVRTAPDPARTPPARHGFPAPHSTAQPHGLPAPRPSAAPVPST